MRIEEGLLRQAGFTAWGFTKVSQVVFSDEVRKLCAQNACGRYGKSWACPPGVGTLEECRSKCLAFSKVLVFSAHYPLEDSFDYEGMQAGHRAFQESCAAFASLLPKGRRLLLSNEGCGRCKTCTYPDAPCRFPQELSPPVESYGIRVDLLAKSAGIPYLNGANTVTYFGALFFEPEA